MESHQCRTQLSQSDSMRNLSFLGWGGLSGGGVEAVVLGTDEIAVEGLDVGVEDLGGTLHLVLLEQVAG